MKLFSRIIWIAVAFPVWSYGTEPTAAVAANGVSSWWLFFPIALAFAVAGAGVLAWAYFRVKRQLLRLQGIWDLLPVRVGVCDRNGRLLAVHAEDEFRSALAAAQTVPELPGIENSRQIATCIQAAFEHDGPPVREVVNPNREVSLQRLPAHYFGCDAVLWCSWDVAEWQRQARQQELSLRRNRMLLREMTGGVIVASAEGRIEFINPAAERLLKISGRKLLDFQLERIFKPVAADGTVLPLLEPGVEGEHVRNGFLLLGDGRRRAVGFQVAPLEGAGSGEEGCMVFFWDDTLRCEAERRQQELTRIVTLSMELAQSEWFRLMPLRNEVTGSANLSRLWPLRNGMPLLPEEWVCREDLPAFLAGWEKVAGGTGEAEDIVFRAGYYGKLRRYHMRAQREVPGAGSEEVIYGIIQDVTGATKAQQEPYVELLHDTLFQSLPFPFFIKEISDNYRYKACNQSFLSQLRRDSGDVLNKTDFELFPARLAARLHAEDQQVNAGGKALEFFEEFPDADGVIYNSHAIKFARNTADGRRFLIGAAMDITAYENQRRALEAQLGLYEKIFRFLPIGVAVKDAEDDFRYLMWNPALERLTGRNSSGVVGRTDLEIEPCRGAGEKFRADDLAVLASGLRRNSLETFEVEAGRTLCCETTTGLLLSDDHRYMVEAFSDRTRMEEEKSALEQQIHELSDHVGMANTVNSCLKRISEGNDFDRAIKDMLVIIGGALGADRCYIGAYAEDLSSWSCTHEWTRDGISSRREKLPQLELSECTGWVNRMLKHEPVLLDDINQVSADLKPIVPALRKLKLQSLLCLGIYIDGKLSGFAGVDFVREKRPVTERDIRMLQNVVSIYVLAYQRKVHVDLISAGMAVQKLIIDMMPVPVILINRDFTIAHVNAAALKGSGLEGSAAGSVGRHCYGNFCRRQAPDDTCTVLKAIRQKSSVTEERVIYGRNVQISAVPIIRDGEVVQILECVVDLTEVTRSRELMAQAAAAAEEAAKSKTMFLATMSHELRTPLNAVIGFTELLQLGELAPEEQREAVEAIHLAGTTLLTLINDILDISKLEAGQLELNPVKTDLRRMLAEVKTIFSPRLQQSRLNFTVDIPTSVPVMLLDQLRTRQVLLNLIGNAVKFTAEGGIAVSAGFEPGAEDTGVLTIQIRDTGCGIAAENLPKIFDPFVQDHTGGKHIGKGTGLGLSICKKLIEQMGGRIQLSSVPGKGSNFQVVLEGVSFVREQLPSAPETRPRIVHRSARVLLVDDVPMNLHVTRAMASRIGLETQCAGSAAEALQKLITFPAEVVFSDLWMPEMNGGELAAAIKARPEWRAIKVVAVTADTDIDTNFPTGIFDGVLLKPVTFDKFQQMLERVLPVDPGSE